MLRHQGPESPRLARDRVPHARIGRRIVERRLHEDLHVVRRAMEWQVRGVQPVATAEEDHAVLAVTRRPVARRRGRRGRTRHRNCDEKNG
ncbi:hypothetical protein GCM10027188_21880 [Lysobacter humi (ex Lee et al. 2017)]